MDIEIVHDDVLEKTFKSHASYTKEYVTHIGYGASGQYDEKTRIGKISSHKKKCKMLEKKGYKNLKFCNGGDDDVLVIDHDTKTFGFFEDYAPFGRNLSTAKTLTELWENHR